MINTMPLKKLMKYRIIDIVIGFLLIVELIYLSTHIAISLSLAGSFFDFYEGLPLVLFISRIFLYFSIGFLAAILFFMHFPASKWALLAYVGLVIISKYWIIKPNSPQYFKFVSDMQASLTRSIGSENIIIHGHGHIYPYWWIKALYFIGLIYVFFIRGRYIKRIRSEAVQEPRS
jgi:hypothetical protein